MAFQGAASFIATLEKPETIYYVWAGFLTMLHCVAFLKQLLINIVQIWKIASKLIFQCWKFCTIYVCIYIYMVLRDYMVLSGPTVLCNTWFLRCCLGDEVDRGILSTRCHSVGLMHMPWPAFLLLPSWVSILPSSASFRCWSCGV